MSFHVSTADRDERVTVFRTPQWVARVSKNGCKVTITRLDGSRSTSTTHVYPHLVIRRTLDSWIPQHQMHWYISMMCERAVRVRTTFVRAFPNSDVARLVVEFLGFTETHRTILMHYTQFAEARAAVPA